MSKYVIEIKYEVIESIDVEAADIEAAEEKAIEMLQLGATDHNIVGDNIDDLEWDAIYTSNKVEK